MTSSTANVAIPAASPERRIRAARREGEDPADAQQAGARGRSPPSYRPGNRTGGHRRRLLGDGDGQRTGRPGADRHEADVPERQHAGVPDEHVERHDDRHGDERVDEVDLGQRSKKLPTTAVTTTSAAGASTGRNVGRSPHPLHGPAGPREEAAGPQDEDQDHEAEEERRQVLALRCGQRAPSRPDA